MSRSKIPRSRRSSTTWYDFLHTPSQQVDLEIGRSRMNYVTYTSEEVNLIQEGYTTGEYRLGAGTDDVDARDKEFKKRHLVTGYDGTGADDDRDTSMEMGGMGPVSVTAKDIPQEVIEYGERHVESECGDGTHAEGHVIRNPQMVLSRRPTSSINTDDIVVRHGTDKHDMSVEEQPVGENNYGESGDGGDVIRIPHTNPSIRSTPFIYAGEVVVGNGTNTHDIDMKLTDERNYKTGGDEPVRRLQISLSRKPTPYTDTTDAAVMNGTYNYDENVDLQNNFNWFHLICGVVSLFVYVGDVYTDIALSVRYFQADQVFFGTVTIVLVVGPSLVVCCFGIHWYLIDYYREMKTIEKIRENKDKYWKPDHETPKWLWVLRLVCTILQIGILMRTVEYLYYGFKSMRSDKKVPRVDQIKYNIRMRNEDLDACFLRMFESFLEAAPQLTFKLYAWATLKPEEDVVSLSLRIIGILLSWGSFSFSLYAYNKSLRYSRRDNKNNMSVKATVIYFIWRTCEVGGRILCFSLFAIVFKLWIFLPLFLHWVLVTVWIVKQKTNFYDNFCLEKIFNVICGYVMIFCFLNLREGHTRFRYIVYYAVFYVENGCMIGLWFSFVPPGEAWYYNYGFPVIFALSAFHILMQLIYYKFFHPQHIKSCLPCTRDIWYKSVCYQAEDEDKSQTIIVISSNDGSKSQEDELNADQIDSFLDQASPSNGVSDKLISIKNV